MQNSAWNSEKVNSSGGGDVHDNDRAHILLLTCWVEKLSFGRPLSLVVKGGPKIRKSNLMWYSLLRVLWRAGGKVFVCIKKKYYVHCIICIYKFGVIFGLGFQL